MSTRLWPLLAALLWLSGCATHFAADRQGLAESLATQGLAPDEIANLDDGPLSREQAVWWSLQHHPRARRLYAELDIEAAEVSAAAQWSNPTLSLEVLYPEGGGTPETSFGLSQRFTELLFRQRRQDLARQHYQAQQWRLQGELQQLALTTEQAWFSLVSAEKALAVAQLTEQAASLTARLAQRFRDAGNLSALSLAGYQRDAAEARLDLLATQQQRDQQRIRLAEQLNIAVDGAWSVPAQLPLPPQTLPDLQTLQQAAAQENPELKAARWRAQQASEQQQLVQRSRWFGELSVGLAYERDGGGRATGPSLSLGLPLFHRNQAAIQQAEAQRYWQQMRLDEQAERLGYRLAQKGAALSWLVADIYERRDTLLPALEAQVERRQERVNYMFDDVFDVLEARRHELASWQQLVDQVGQFWQIHSALMALAGEHLVSLHGLPLLDIDLLAKAAPEAQHGDHDHDHQQHNRDHQQHHNGDHDHHHGGHH